MVVNEISSPKLDFTLIYLPPNKAAYNSKNFRYFLAFIIKAIVVYTHSVCPSQVWVDNFQLISGEICLFNNFVRVSWKSDIRMIKCTCIKHRILISFEKIIE